MFLSQDQLEKVAKVEGILSALESQDLSLSVRRAYTIPFIEKWSPLNGWVLSSFGKKAIELKGFGQINVMGIFPNLADSLARSLLDAFPGDPIDIKIAGRAYKFP